MATTKEKIHTFQYTWIKALPLFRSYLLDLGESLRKDLKSELERKTPNEAAAKEMTDALKSVVNLLSSLTEMMRLFFGEDSLKELPTVRYLTNSKGARQPYVRRGNWGGPRPGSGNRKNKTEAVAPKVSEERAAIEAFDSLLSAAKPAAAVAPEKSEAKPAKPAAKRGSLISPIKKKKTAPRKVKKVTATPAPSPSPSAPIASIKVPTMAEAMKEIEARFDAILDQATWTTRSTKEG